MTTSLRLTPQRLSERLKTWDGHRPRLWMFDFDGTLAPLAFTPEAANMSSYTRASLGAMAHQRQCRVAVVSGRGLPDLKCKVGIPGAIYIGNHGLSSSWPELRPTPVQLRQWRDTARQAERKLVPVITLFPGSLLENKGVDLSVHYRRVEPSVRPWLLRSVQRMVRRLPLRWHRGKHVLELRPPDERNKGTAVFQLAARLADQRKLPWHCLYVGDDRTDEDAFAVLRSMGERALSIKVGPGATCAEYRLPHQSDIDWLLRILAGNK